jgi:hypothetical protein
MRIAVGKFLWAAGDQPFFTPCYTDEEVADSGDQFMPVTLMKSCATSS